MMRHDITTSPPGKTPTPSDPKTADEFDSALRVVCEKYHTDAALTRGELTALVNATVKLMLEVR